MQTTEEFLTRGQPLAPRVASINGMALHDIAAGLPAEELRQRACTELLRQRAQDLELLAADDRPELDGTISEAAARAIEQVLEQELEIPEPSESDCQRYFAGQIRLHTQGERLHLRHILFAMTSGINAMQLAQKAEQVLMDVRCDDDAGKRFAEAAEKFSNCPSSQQGGDLGWLARTDCVPEFADDIFGKKEVGVLSRLVRSRFGLHIVEVLERDPGREVNFEDVHDAVAAELRRQTWVSALRQYLQLLAGDAEIVGVDLDAAGSPLVQ